MGKTDLIISVLAIFGLGMSEVLIVMLLWELGRFFRIAADVLAGKRPFNVQMNTNIRHKTEEMKSEGVDG